MDLNFKWAEKRSKGRGEVEVDSIARLSVIKNGMSKGKVKKALTIVFYDSMIKNMRLMAGDLIEIGFDKTARLVAVKRTTSDNGYKLSKMGKTLRTQIKENAYPFIHESIYIKEDNFFEQDGIFVFNLNSFDVKIK